MEEARFRMLLKFIDFDRLTDWETEFLESVEKRFERGRNLTKLQEETLEKIYRERQ